MSEVTYPNVGFGLKSIPTSQSVHFKNATLWTNEDAGIIQNSDIIIDNGKIIAIGKDLETPLNFKIVDATGKHITSGIIDEHSHMAASSINEGGHNSSAEVSIMDVNIIQMTLIYTEIFVVGLPLSKFFMVQLIQWRTICNH